jgi:phage internal scaffolding protein
MLNADIDGVLIGEVFVRTRYNYDRNAASDAAALICVPEESRTQQQFAEECDINTIVKRFGLTGELPENFRVPQSGDFTNIGDFHSAMNAVRSAEEAFMDMPAELRARFGYDPQKLMDFVHDSKNRDEAIKLGLVEKPPERPRDVVTAVDELAARFKVDPPVVK